VPEELHDFFESNYEVAANELFGAAAETLKLFQKNNWGMEGGFLAVLHTWGRALNWHPHLHVLVSAGGRDCTSGTWKTARANYLFPVRLMSKVFGAIFLRRLEALEDNAEIRWPEELATAEQRKTWRVKMAKRNWNIFSRATLGNTRAVVRYLARYTSRIAISNQRIKKVDMEKRTVSFEWKDYKDGQQIKEMTMEGGTFLRCFTRHLVPKGFRRIRYFGLLAGRKGRIQELPGAPQTTIDEKTTDPAQPVCSNCGSSHWKYFSFYKTHQLQPGAIVSPSPTFQSTQESESRFSLSPSRASPIARPTRG
jgi:hypothetical protein